MSVVKGICIGEEICKALDLPDDTIEAHIHIVPDEVVTIELLVLAKSDGLTKVINILKEYELHEKIK